MNRPRDRRTARLLLLGACGAALIAGAAILRARSPLYHAALRRASLPALETLAQRHPTDADTQYCLGRAAFLAGRYDEARAAFTAAVNLAPERAAAHAGLALCLYAQGDMSGARTEAQMAADREETSGAAEALLARLDWSERRIPDALQHAQRATAKSPHNARYWFALGRYYISLARHAEAINAIQTAVRLSPGVAEYADVLAGLLLETGQPQQAQDLLERQIQQHREDMRARLLLAEYLLNSSTDPHAPHRAIELLRDSDRLHGGESGQARYDLGLAYLKCGQAAHAIQSLQAALATGYSPERIYFALSSGYAAMGNRPAAEAARGRFTWLSARRLSITEMERRYNADPARVELLREGARAYRDIGQPLQAAQQYETYLRLRPGDTTAQHELAQVARKAQAAAQEQEPEPLPVPPD